MCFFFFFFIRNVIFRLTDLFSIRRRWEINIPFDYTLEPQPVRFSLDFMRLITSHSQWLTTPPFAFWIRFFSCSIFSFSLIVTFNSVWLVNAVFFLRFMLNTSSLFNTFFILFLIHLGVLLCASIKIQYTIIKFASNIRIKNGFYADKMAFCDDKFSLKSHRLYLYHYHFTRFIVHAQMSPLLFWSWKQQKLTGFLPMKFIHSPKTKIIQISCYSKILFEFQNLKGLWCLNEETGLFHSLKWFKKASKRCQSRICQSLWSIAYKEAT